MAGQLKLRRGTTSQLANFIGSEGELTYNTTLKSLVLHDGVTAGGVKIPYLSDGRVPSTMLPNATETALGVVILNNTLTSTSTTQALTAAQGKVLGDRDFGVGQSWQDFTSSRGKNVVYTNNTGKPIEVAIKVAYSDDDGGLTVTVGGVDIGRIQGNAPSGTGYWQTTMNFTVPNLATYVAAGGSSVFGWLELR